MLDCKKALAETNGDMDKAVDYLREKGISKESEIWIEMLPANEGDCILITIPREDNYLLQNLFLCFPCCQFLMEL